MPLNGANAGVKLKRVSKEKTGFFHTFGAFPLLGGGGAGQEVQTPGGGYGAAVWLATLLLARLAPSRIVVRPGRWCCQPRFCGR